MSAWDAKQIAAFVQDAIKNSVGKRGWTFLGPEIQRAIIKARAVDVVCSQVEGARMEAREVRELVFAMLAEAGLE